MKKERLITLALCVVLVIVSVWAIGSYDGVKDKLELEGENQGTMEVMEAEVEPEVTPEEVPVPEEIKTEEAEVVTEALSTDQTSTEVTEAEELQEPENPEAPVLKLSGASVTITVGEDFHVISPVEEITDDKDDPMELFRYIRVGGEYDVNTPGEYTLEYIVTDLDGNDSASQKLTLIVVE